MIFRDMDGTLRNVLPSAFNTDKQYYQSLQNLHIKHLQHKSDNSNYIANLIQSAGMVSSVDENK